MIQKSSPLQHANSVSQVLIPDTRSGRALMLSVTRCAFLSPQLRRRARPQAALNSETEGSASIVPMKHPLLGAGGRWFSFRHLHEFPQKGANALALGSGDVIAGTAAVLLCPPPVPNHTERPTTVITFSYCRHGTLGSLSVRSRTQHSSEQYRLLSYTYLKSRMIRLHIS